MTTQRDTTRIRHNTKIVATLCPASNDVELLRDMINVGGLNVVRFNFSHGTAEFHQENAKIVREAARLMGAPDSYKIPGSYNDGYTAMGDAVAMPVARYLAQHLLAPLGKALHV